MHNCVWSAVFAIGAVVVLPSCLEVASEPEAHDTVDTADEESCLQCHHQEGFETVDCLECHQAQSPSHVAHLETSMLSQAIECADCHPLPVTLLGDSHLDAEVDVHFLHPLATADGLEPTWDGTQCNDLYCHGANLDGGTFVPPVWDGSFPADPCAACHGNPPSSSPHSPSWTVCTGCHAAAYEDGELNPAVHIDGVLEQDK